MVSAGVKLVVVEELLGDGEEAGVGPEVPDQLGDTPAVIINQSQ